MKLLKRLGCLTVLAIVVALAWKVYRAIEDRPPLTAEERAGQAETQRKQAVALRLKELEDTNGAGRERLSKDVENAARILYNTRHGANLPLK